jgi:tape measure domain-containing protein
METVVIEIQSRYKDNTGAGIKETSVKVNQFAQSVEKANAQTKQASSGMDKFSQSIKKTQDQTKKASVDLGELAKKAKDIASKAISIPVKILDYATRPLRGIWNFMTSIKGIVTGFLAGQVWNKAVSGPLALADAYKGAFIGFQSLFKSQEKAQKMMNDLDEFARTTPFKTSGVIAQSQKMLAMGWDADKILKDMKTIGDAAAATGKGEEGLSRISLALSQIKSKGKLSTEELNQLAEAGIGAKRYISQGLGLGSDDASLQKMTKLLEGGKIGADQAIGYILAGMEREYGGMMESTAKETLSGIKSNLEDTFEINIFRKWGQGLQEGAKKGLGVVVDLLDKNQAKLAAFGDQLKAIGAAISNELADKAKDALEVFMKLSETADFKNADIFGKISMAWDKIVAEPFNEWWAARAVKRSGKRRPRSVRASGMRSLRASLMALSSCWAARASCYRAEKRRMRSHGSLAVRCSRARVRWASGSCSGRRQARWKAARWWRGSGR